MVFILFYFVFFGRGNWRTTEDTPKERKQGGQKSQDISNMAVNIKAHRVSSIENGNFFKGGDSDNASKL